jgi:hypothetical protein
MNKLDFILIILLFIADINSEYIKSNKVDLRKLYKKQILKISENFLKIAKGIVK